MYQIRVILLQWFWSVILRKKSFFFLNFMWPWQPNKMATGHKTHKLESQSSNDHNCQIWFTSFHCLWENAIFPFFNYKSKEAVCCPGNQTNRQTGIPLAVLNCPPKQYLYQIRVILLQWLSRGPVISCLCFFPFDVSDGRCGIIVSIPDHCLPFYFVI